VLIASGKAKNDYGLRRGDNDIAVCALDDRAQFSVFGR